jgi:hypothetical protein
MAMTWEAGSAAPEFAAFFVSWVTEGFSAAEEEFFEVVGIGWEALISVNKKVIGIDAEGQSSMACEELPLAVENVWNTGNAQ